ncbi:TPA: hypothetical protein ACPJYS_000791, partial [Haemophilus influenzae]
TKSDRTFLSLRRILTPKIRQKEQKMNKLIITLVCAFVVYMAHALNLNQDCDGKICHTEIISTIEGK